MKNEFSQVTSDGISFRTKWVAIDRWRSQGARNPKVIILYQKFGSVYDYKVQVYNRTSEIWKSFDDYNRAIDFFKMAKKKWLWKNKFYSNASKLLTHVNIHGGRGRTGYPETIRTRTMDLLLKGHTIEQITEIMGISDQTIMRWTKIYKLKYGKGGWRMIEND